MIIASVPLVFVTNETPVWVLTVAYAVLLAGNAFCFSPAVSEAFLDVPHTDISHATALNNALRQISGAVSVTLMVVLSDLPGNLVSGTRLAFSFTVILIVAYLCIFLAYMSKRKES